MIKARLKFGTRMNVNACINFIESCQLHYQKLISFLLENYIQLIDYLVVRKFKGKVKAI